MYPFKLVAELRPYSPFSVYACPVQRRGQDETIEHRFAVRWDEDNDERVLAAIQNFYFCDQERFRFCHAFGEHKGMFTVWQLGFHDEVHQAVVPVLGHPGLGGDQWSLEVVENELPGLLGRAPLDRAPSDDEIAALHRLFVLGSFVRPDRPWG